MSEIVLKKSKSLSRNGEKPMQNAMKAYQPRQKVLNAMII